MRIISEIFERKLFLLFLLVLIIILIINIGKPTLEIWGINKTVGWAYDLTVPNLMITCVISLLFTLTYFAFFIFKKKTHKIISAVHIVAFGFVTLTYKYLDEGTIFIFNIILIITYLVNVAWALISKKNVKPIHNR